MCLISLRFVSFFLCRAKQWFGEEQTQSEDLQERRSGLHHGYFPGRAGRHGVHGGRHLRRRRAVSAQPLVQGPERAFYERV